MKSLPTTRIRDFVCSAATFASNERRSLTKRLNPPPMPPPLWNEGSNRVPGEKFVALPVRRTPSTSKKTSTRRCASAGRATRATAMTTTDFMSVPFQQKACSPVSPEESASAIGSCRLWKGRSMLHRITFALLFAATAGWAQQQSPPYGEKVDVNLVLLDAVVTDARGNQILGLDKNDFVVKENGVPQDIDSVDYFTNRRLLSSPESKAAFKVERVHEQRYFIFF